MTKLCPRGKAAAKRKFKVYPSAYANAYASRICAGKIKDPSGVKRKDFRGPKKAMGGRIGLKEGFLPESEKNKTLKKLDEKKKSDSESFKKDPFSKFKKKIGRPTPNSTPKRGQATDLLNKKPKMEMPMMSGGRVTRAGGGLMEATARLKKQGLKGGGISQRGLGRAFMKGGRV